MALDHLRHSPAGRVIQAGQGEAGYAAFVPHPLPPDLALDWELARTLAEAERALGELAGLGRSLTNPQLLVRPFIRREAVLSSRIEGTQADLIDLYAYEAGQLHLAGSRPPPSEADVREVLNYVHALEYGLDRLDTLPVSLRLIRELHERLMTGVRGDQATPGEFRRSQNWIGRPGSTLATATYIPPPVDEMHTALDAFEKYMHTEDQYPPLVRLAFIHYQFEAIHPFLDGNGRIGRLLLGLLLADWQLLPIPLLYLSAYFERHRDTYYDLLLAVSERGAWREWTTFCLQAVLEQARDTNTKAKQFQDLQLEWRQHLTRLRVSVLTLQLADRLFDSPIVSISDVERILDASYNGAKRVVEKLVEVGILRQSGTGSYAKSYSAPRILAILGAAGEELH